MTSYRPLLAVPLILAATIATSVPAHAATATESSALPAPIAAYAQSDLTASQWALPAVNAAPAWRATQGAGVTVAILDSGLSYSAEFAGRVPAAYQWDDGEIVAVDPQTMEDSIGHGTHVAGIVAAAADGHGVTGVAPQATIMPVGLTTLLTGESSDMEFASGLAKAITFASDHGANVINMSLGASIIDLAHLPALNPLCQSIADATGKGTIVVVAAGNSGDVLNPLSVPAACPGAISVAALNPDLTPTNWSSADATVSIAAPGSQILSTWPTTGDAANPLGYAVESGTSMASPMVAGIAALVRAVHPEWSAAQVQQQLEGTAKDVGTSGRDPFVGAGAIDAAAAVGVDAPAPAPQPAVEVNVVNDINLSDLGYSECGPCAYVAWRPFNASVASYELVHTFADGHQEMFALPSGDLRHVLTNAVPGDWVALNALLADGSRINGVPLLLSGASDSVRITNVKGHWVKPGVMRVTWDMTSTIPATHVDVQLLAGITSVRTKAVDAGARSALIVVPTSLTGLSLSPAVVADTLSSGRYGAVGRAVAPWYPVAMHAERAGSAVTALVGMVNEDAMSKDADAFIGATAAVRLPSGVTLRAPIQESGLFTLVIPKVHAKHLALTLTIEPGDTPLPKSARGSQRYVLSTKASFAWGATAGRVSSGR